MTKNLSADFSRRIFLEGRATARPFEEFFGTVGAVPSEFSPNEFGAQNFRHQPLKAEERLEDLHELGEKFKAGVS